MSQIQRDGKVSFGDASISVWEDPERRGWEQWQEYEKGFKRLVFKRIIQQLNRLGWSVSPWDKASEFSAIAHRHRTCRKGILQAELSVSGRHLELEMWQGVSTPNRPDNGGRYEPNKEAVMPYLAWLEMERTRRRIRDYLCNVFAGYEFPSERTDGRQNKCGPKHLTAFEWVDGCYETSWHFKGDISSYEISNGNRTSADGEKLNHGQRVWFADNKGRICTGVALYNINNMWWVVTGKYGVTNEGASSIYTSCPENPRHKRNGRLRRQRLEAELSLAIKSMDFIRAHTLKQLLFPGDEPLYMVYHKGHGCYHRSSFCGYTNDSNSAGKFTWQELGRFRPKSGGLEDDLSRIVPLNTEEQAA